MATRPHNVGIKAIEIYFPARCVDQAELEKYDGVSDGKYTIGLGQTRMSFCDDREDIYSIALTTLSNLINKYNIDPDDIGRLEVGTETILDKSKSVKSVLMQLFQESGNHNVEGIDNINACFGGTAAIFNTVNWFESSAWDGRNAIVVAGDIALYKKGSARPTGGVGCVAMLIGPDAPIAFEPGLRGAYITHAYDFYKPDFTSEYPFVDGRFSSQCYLEAVDKCYNTYKLRLKSTNSSIIDHVRGDDIRHEGGIESMIDQFDYLTFHAPYCKLVSKSYGRMLYNDFLADPTNPEFASVETGLGAIDYKASLTDKNIEKTFMRLTKERFAQRVQPAIQVATQCGNMYCGSVYGGLVSLISNVAPKALQDKRIGVFSYGSGIASAMFSLKVVGDTTEMVEKLNLQERLDSRKIVAPKVYDDMCLLREKAHLQRDFKPTGSIDDLVPGTYYLTKVDDMFRREYAVKA